jgi:hypothetical protein
VGDSEECGPPWPSCPCVAVAGEVVGDTVAVGDGDLLALGPGPVLGVGLPGCAVDDALADWPGPVVPPGVVPPGWPEPPLPDALGVPDLELPPESGCWPP